MNRRQYLQRSAAFATGLIVQHLTLPPLCNFKSHLPLIREIHLQTAVEIESLVAFYSINLGFKILNEGDDHCSFVVGESILKFSRCINNTQPHYHFAFNIAQKKINSAESWMKSKAIEIIAPPSHLTDRPKFSRDVVYFRHWDAHAIFFYDPAGNVVEFIARHSLKDNGQGDFSLNDVHFISEIALVTDDVSNLGGEIENTCELIPYNRQSDTFAALGSERGLVLCFKSGRRAVFGSGRKRKAYKTDIYLQHSQNLPDFKNSPFSIYNIQ